MAKKIGLFLGPGLFVLTLALPVPGLAPAGKRVLALALWMAGWWMTEAVPIPGTSLLPLVLLPLLRVIKLKDAALAYADPVVFLFLGGFLIARAMEVHGLHRRIALPFVLAGKGKPWALLLGFMLATAFLSMWVSNTATTMMMLPIALAALAHIPHKRFGVALMLGVAYSASVGGMATLVGTPPNLVLAGQLPRLAPGAEIGFAQWMGFALPLSAVLLGLIWLYLSFYFKTFGIRGGTAMAEARKQWRDMGPLRGKELFVLVVFALVALAWITRKGLFGLPGWENLLGLQGYTGDATVAILGALALMCVPGTWKKIRPVLTWEEGKNLPWGVLILFGGGLSLASAFGSSGLSAWVARGLSGLRGAPVWLVVMCVAGAVSLLTELTSNTATAALVIPILAGAGAAMGVSPYALTVPAALAASCAFTLPVATPPNAIVYGSGKLSIGQMFRVGIVINGMAVALITLLAVLVLPRVFG